MHNKIETKNVMGAKVMEFIKTFDQYPHQLKLCDIFNASLHESLDGYRGRVVLIEYLALR